MFKFAVKVGLATAAVYYIKDQGIWKNSSESIKTYDKLKESVRPYVQEAKAQIPIELPTLPETDNLCSLTKQTWNAGIMATFKFLSELPETTSRWTQKGVNAALQNPEIKQFVDSFSSKSGSVEKK